MENYRPYKTLRAWQRGMDIVIKIYSITSNFPTSELYGLVGQLRRAAVSIPANIAEGMSRRGRKDKLHFLNIAQASANELVPLQLRNIVIKYQPI